jgi:hypothetical protein
MSAFWLPTLGGLALFAKLDAWRIGVLLRHRQQERIVVERGGDYEPGAAVGDQALHRLAIGSRLGVVLAAPVIGTLGEIVRLDGAGVRNPLQRQGGHGMGLIPAPIEARTDIDETRDEPAGARNPYGEGSLEQGRGAERPHGFEQLAPIAIEARHISDLRRGPAWAGGLGPESKGVRNARA